jgi:hypothetical protein
LAVLYRHKFSINWFVKNFIRPTCKSDMWPLNIWKSHIFLLMLLKKHVKKYMLLKQHVILIYQWMHVNRICGLYEIFYKPVCMKFLSVLHAVELYREMSFNDIILEGNALQIVTMIKAKGNNWSKFGHIVDGIKEGLWQLTSWSIIHIKRSAYEIVHTIAREAILYVINRVWVEKTPNCISDIVRRQEFSCL